MSLPTFTGVVPAAGITPGSAPLSHAGPGAEPPAPGAVSGTSVPGRVDGRAGQRRHGRVVDGPAGDHGTSAAVAGLGGSRAAARPPGCWASAAAAIPATSASPPSHDASTPNGCRWRRSGAGLEVA